jgi:hypothetical protein
LPISASNEREVRSGARVFHVRAASGTNSQQQSPLIGAPPRQQHIASAGGTVINRLQQQRRQPPPTAAATAQPGTRQDSGDDASGSLGSGSTLASGQQTPLTQRRLQQQAQQMAAAQPVPLPQGQRFKMRRPRSTGQIIIQQQQQHQQQQHQARKKHSESAQVRDGLKELENR